ncbi:MAG: DNA-directed RNA polymerase subunit A' [Candidatus Heimdallarchaeota archaeon]|nr:DNA-directed RNA polymerase subunit A' [Candidatus Heimdallarchaeota archaeon]
MAFKLPKIIRKIQFGLLSADEIRKMSVVRVITADTYDEDGTAIPSGLMDGRLGTIDPGQRCKTCGNRVGECEGHFGHIELARPIIHVGFNKKIYKILRATCFECSRILLTEEEIYKYKQEMVRYQKRWDQTNIPLINDLLKKAAKNDKCPHCQSTQTKIRLEKPTTFYEETKANKKAKTGERKKLSPSDVRDRLERIPDDDCPLLGVNPAYARPEWMILTVLPVPPVAMRPSITLESSIRSEDDLTHKLVDIIRINQRLRENIEAGAPQLIVEDLWELLQYHVTTYFNNEVSGIPPARHRSGRALRTLTQRLKGKEGRFRSNLCGKRVDFSSRTVISPDPNLSINEVGVPEEIAMQLTIPERVTEWNIEELKELVMRGPVNHPGANYIIRQEGLRIDLRFVKEKRNVADSLEPGFIVERHLKNGDIVLFNRQPSLHRMSIMAHKVKVMPYRTFRLNLCVCPPYNADFDGDEMNLHVPQSEEAQAEARTLMLAQEQISSPRYGGPLIGANWDYISASYLLTRHDTYFTKKEAMQMIVSAGSSKNLPPPKITQPVELWSGKQLFSMFLPEGTHYTNTAKICHKCTDCLKENCQYDAYVTVRNGILETGVIDKKAIGSQQEGSLLGRILVDYGTTVAREFLDGVTKLFIRVLSFKGFSMGFWNIDIPREAKARIDEILDEAEKETKETIDAYRQGILERLPGRSQEETLEMKIMEILSKSRSTASDVAGEYLGMENEAVIMAKTGARGSMLNLGQMAACLGQQSVRGERIQRGFKNRTLPHFKQGALDAPSRGFVRNSFRRGLTPIEFFMHACGGREGLVDTAVRTSTSGYMQRRLIHALLDIKAEYDGTVRGAESEVIQFKYGDDGIDPAKTEHGKSVNIDAIIDRVLKTTIEE